MCSMESNSSGDDALNELNDKDRQMVIDRMVRFAAEADVDQQGALDVAPLRNMPDALTGVRKKTVGRHRVYYVGHHTDCSYRMFHVKTYKKAGVDDEHDSRFQRKLAEALEGGGAKVLSTGDADET